MTLETELKKLVKYHKKTEALHHNEVIALDRDFSKLINQQLLVHGPTKEKITRQYRKLSLYFHPDQVANFSPEVLWIEEQLSEQKNDGACFKSLRFSYEKLTSPEQFKDVNFSDIKTDAEFKKWLEGLRAQSETYTGRSLYDSLIQLFEQAGGFLDATGTIKPRAIRYLVRSVPMIFVTYGSVLFVEELFAVYSLYFLVLKGGQFLETGTHGEIHEVGKVLKEISIVTATATTTLMVRLLEMTFWASRQCWDVTLQIGSTLISPLAPEARPYKRKSSQAPTETAMNLCRDLILASKIPTGGMEFKTPELKIIAAPIESYKALNEEQFLGNWRIARGKGIAVKAFLFSMGVLDQLPMPLADKLLEAQKELDKIKRNSEVYSRKTKRAVLAAEHVITLLKEPEEIKEEKPHRPMLAFKD